VITHRILKKKKKKKLSNQPDLYFWYYFHSYAFIILVFLQIAYVYCNSSGCFLVCLFVCRFLWFFSISFHFIFEIVILIRGSMAMRMLLFSPVLVTVKP
jgi:hypothetical protein